MKAVARREGNRANAHVTGFRSDNDLRQWLVMLPLLIVLTGLSFDLLRWLDVPAQIGQTLQRLRPE